MRIVAFTEGVDHVCSRYRIQAYAGELERRGWRLQLVPLARRTLDRYSQFEQARQADVVILQRKLLPLWQLRLLRKQSAVLVYDFDDALFGRDSFARKGSSSLSRLARFWATIYSADLVLAGNNFLAQQAARYIEVDRVRAVPTTVDPTRYPQATHPERGGALRLAWIGQPSTLACLVRAQPLWTAAAARLPHLELRVICSRFPELSDIRVVERPWSSHREGPELAACDVGVSWLPNDTWSQGKCGLKVLQYMAAGLPVVANPVGPNRQLVVHGQTGLLAETPEEWAAALAQLAADQPLRARLGAAGRRFVEQHYSARGWAAPFADYLMQAVRRQRRQQALGEVGASPC